MTSNRPRPATTERHFLAPPENETQDTDNVLTKTDHDFIDWFNQYPKRTGYDTAHTAYHNCRNRGIPADILTHATKNYKNDINKRQLQSPRFIHTPTHWLNNDNWIDYLQPADPNVHWPTAGEPGYQPDIAGANQIIQLTDPEPGHQRRKTDLPPDTPIDEIWID